MLQKVLSLIHSRANEAADLEPFLFLAFPCWIFFPEFHGKFIVFRIPKEMGLKSGNVNSYYGSPERNTVKRIAGNHEAI
jgi:hypothetical protein